MKMAGVHWRVRNTPTEEEICTHFDGDYTVEVSDKDGDVADWAVSKANIVIASGTVPEVCIAERPCLDVALDIAVAALRAIKAPDVKS